MTLRSLLRPARFVALAATVLAACGPAKTEADLATRAEDAEPAAFRIDLSTGTPWEDPDPITPTEPTTPTGVPSTGPLAFTSAFGEGVGLAFHEYVPGLGYRQPIAGADGGSDWSELPGAHLWYGLEEGDDLGRAVATRIETVDGPGAGESGALILESLWDPRAPVAENALVFEGEAAGLTTIAYDLRLPADFGDLLPESGAQTTFEIFGVDAAEGGADPFEWSVAVARRPDTSPDLHWRVRVRPDVDSETRFSRFITDVAVPVGDWFRVEITYRLDPIAGSFELRVDEQVIASFEGPTGSTASPPIVTVVSVDQPPVGTPARSITVEMTNLDIGHDPDG